MRLMISITLCTSRSLPRITITSSPSTYVDVDRPEQAAGRLGQLGRIDCRLRSARHNAGAGLCRRSGGLSGFATGLRCAGRLLHHGG